MKPHKACNADLNKIKFPIIVMPKIDGVRACYLNGEFTSRNLKPFRNKRLSETFEIPDLFDYDGELVVGDDPTSQSLCRDTTSFCSSFENKTEHLDTPTWYLFDLVLEGVPYKERLAKLQMEVSMLSALNLPIKIVRHAIAESIEEVMQWHDMFMAEGYEGTILRDPNGYHKNGRCTVNEGAFLKMKDIADEEAAILSLIEAEYNGNEAEVNELGYQTRSSHQENKVGNGMIGSIVVMIPDGRVITISAGHMTHDERIHYWENQDEIVNRICTYKFMPHGEKDKRRHPRFKCFRSADK